MITFIFDTKNKKAYFYEGFAYNFYNALKNNTIIDGYDKYVCFNGEKTDIYNGTVQLYDHNNKIIAATPVELTVYLEL